MELKEKIKKGDSIPIDSLIKLNKKTMVFSQGATIFIYNLNEQ